MASKKTKRQPKTISRKPSADGRQSGNLRWLAIAIAAFGVVLYLNTLGHDYVLDDFSVIKENFVGFTDAWHYKMHPYKKKLPYAHIPSFQY